MTKRERLEKKLEKRREWAESRAAKAEAGWEAGDLREEKSGIPFGQPILVGHHSERKHRRAIERADRAMRSAHEHYKMSEYHEQKADGIERQLETSIFSDDEDAVERLKEKIANLEAERQQNNAINKIVRAKPRAVVTPEKIAELEALGLPTKLAEELFDPEGKSCCGKGIPSFVNRNIGGRIKQAKDRIARIERDRATKAKAAATDSGIVIEGGDWISVTFAEKPERNILRDLKAAGFRWGRGSWTGKRENLPEAVRGMADEERGQA